MMKAIDNWQYHVMEKRQNESMTLDTGCYMVTNGCNLNAKWVIHTVSPQPVKEENMYKPLNNQFNFFERFKGVELNYD